MIHRPLLRRNTILALGFALGVMGGLCTPATANSQEISAPESQAPMTAVEFTDGDPLAAWARARLAEIENARDSEETDLQLRLERIRAMYFLSVEEKDWVNQAKDSLRALREDVPEGSGEEITYQAYRGALEVVRAKHARWPGNKLKHLNRGAEVLDDLTLREPDNLEVRYLRLASYMFLPFFLRRDDSVASDLETLVADLPDHPEAFSPAIYRAVVQFLLDNGDLDGTDRDRLRGALQTENPTQNQRNQSEYSDG
jgi:hypothetical protein